MDGLNHHHAVNIVFTQLINQSIDQRVIYSFIWKGGPAPGAPPPAPGAPPLAAGARHLPRVPATFPGCPATCPGCPATCPGCPAACRGCAATFPGCPATRPAGSPYVKRESKNHLKRCLPIAGCLRHYWWMVPA